MASSSSASKRPPVLELVGPAGAGKTTLLTMLSGRDRSIRSGVRVNGREHIPMLIGISVPLLPSVIPLLPSSPRSAGRIMRHMVRLKAFQPAVGRAASPGDRAVVLDEGPIFTLARLTACGRTPPAMSRALERCWWRALDQCARTVDAVIWLDAPDHILAQRIRERAKSHQVKGKAEQTIHEFLSCYRSSYSRIISQLAAKRGTKVLGFSTASESLEQIADKIMAALEAGC
jgi:deoxyadenosine/deoxycytidine kinase